MRYDCDQMARHLIEWAHTAKEMPPAWQGALISQPVIDPQSGVQFGRMLPGMGLYLNTDLKDLGIKKSLPGVFERGRTLRLMDQFEQLKPRSGIQVRLGYDMPELTRIAAAIASYNDIIKNRASGNAQDITVGYNSMTSAATQWQSLWQAGGTGQGGTGTYTANPGATMNNATVGALSFQLSNPGALNKYLLTFGSTATQNYSIAVLVDLLVGAGGFSGTVITAQTITTPALTRYTTGAGVLVVFDVTTALGGTASNLTFSYTNQAGTAGQTSISTAMRTSAAVGGLVPTATGAVAPKLATGDYGVRAVASVTLSASMTAGAFALNMFYPLMWLPGVAANLYLERDSTINVDGLLQLVTEAGGALGCLNIYLLAGTTTTGAYTAFLRTVAG